MLGGNRPRDNYEEDKTSERSFLVFLPMGKLSDGNCLRGNRLRNNYLGSTHTVSIIQGAIFCVCVCVRVCEYVCVCLGGGWGTIIRGTNSIGINYPWGKLSQGQYSGSQLSRGAIAQVTIIREAIFL